MSDRLIVTESGQIKGLHSSHGDVATGMLSGMHATPCHGVKPSPVIGHEHTNHPESRSVLPHSGGDAVSALNDEQKKRAHLEENVHCFVK